MKGAAPHTRKPDEAIRMRVCTPFMHRGRHVLLGEIIECTQAEANGALFSGWAIRVDGERYNRRDMRAKE